MTTKETDPGINLSEWLGAQVSEFSEVHPRYEIYASTLEELLERVTRDMGISAIVQARAKSIPGFAEKVLRKRTSYRDPVREMTDLCGARVIVQTQEDVDRICEFILDNNFEIDHANSMDKAEVLKPSEFGYRSVHYIVQLRADDESQIPRLVAGDVLESLLPQPSASSHPFKAEIQVRTIVQHAWADIGHDRLYKTSFDTPKAFEREAARIAALLENVDDDFSRLIRNVDAYRAHYEAYMSEDERQSEIKTQRLVLERLPEEHEYDHQREAVTLKIAKLHAGLGHWQEVIETVDTYASPSPPLLCLSGHARAQIYPLNSKEFQQGQQDLQQAIQADPQDLEATLHLADSYACQRKDVEALRLYKQAFEISPTDPRALGSYLEHQVADDKRLGVISLLRPDLEAALQRCRNQAEVGVNLPEAHYRAGQFLLLLGKPYEAFWEYSHAVARTTENCIDAIEGAIATVGRLDRAVDASEDQKESFEWVRQFLLVAKAARFPNPQLDLDPRVAELASRECMVPADSGRSQHIDCQPVSSPTVIVAGGCSEHVERQMQSYRSLLHHAFQDFQGTIISGGTTSGVPGLVGELAAESPEIRTIGYLPAQLPADARLDLRYQEIRTTAGSGFSARQPLQNWIDLLASGIEPQSVRLLGINGGEITAFEYCLALTVGAKVGVLGDSGREAGKLVRQVETEKMEGVAVLPKDKMTIATFVQPVISPEFLTEEAVETLAQMRHEQYQQEQRERFKKRDPASRDWPDLSEGLKGSNRDQVRHIARKLQTVGLQAVPVDTGEEIRLYKFSDEQIELLSEMEHARWNIERLLSGWTYGERDHDQKTSPFLVGWEDLDEETKRWDRHTVEAIPGLLKEVGFEIREADPDSVTEPG